MLNNISTYLNKEEYRISIIPSGIHILSYDKIIETQQTDILINIGGKKLKILGENMHISKLDKKELLIKGKIKKVEINE